MGSDGHAAFYFEDSWHYVALPSAGGQTDALHGPMVYWLWDLAIPGAPAEWSVILLQNTLGVLAALAVLFVLRDVTTPSIGLAGSLVYGALPLGIMMDRTLLTESVATFLVAVLLLLVVKLRHERHLIADVAIASLTGLLAGALVSVRPATRLAAPIILGLALVVLVQRFVRARERRTNRVARLFLVAAAIAVSALPAPLVLMDHNDEQFGARSLTPASGSVELAAWGWRTSCRSFDEYTAIARAALLQVCDGNRTNQLWAEGPLHDSLRANPEFAESQREMSHEARKAMLSDPLFTLSDMVSVMRDHAFDPVVDLRGYSNGSIYFSDRLMPWFEKHEHWFSGADARTPMSGRPLIMRMADKTAALPGLAFVLLLFAFPVSAIAGVVFQVKNAEDLSVLRAAVDVLGQPRNLLAVACIGVALAGEVVVGLGGNPVFRYWDPVLPAIVCGLGATVGQLRSVMLHRSSPRPADPPGPAQGAPDLGAQEREAGLQTGVLRRCRATQ